MFRSSLIFLLLSILYSGEFYKGDTLVRKGVYAFYNYDFDTAVEVLEQARIEFPEHPGVHFIWVAARWVRAQANHSVDDTYQILENDLEEIGPVYDALTSKYDYDPIYKLYQGSAIGLTARVSLGKKQWLRSLYRAYKGFKIINEVANEFPDIADSQLPIGIVEYYSGLSTPVLSWAVRLYDLSPSTESGVQRIAIAAEEGSWSWVEAKAILSNLYLWVEDEPILAVEYTQDLVRQFPDNYYFSLLYLESMIQTNNISLSSTIINDMEKKLDYLTDRQRDWYGPYLFYEKALLEFQKKNYEGALDLLSNTIENYSAELDFVLGNAYLLQGMAYDMLYNRSKAKESYYNCIYLDNFSGSIDKARLFLKQPYEEH